ncbi:MAG TPA: bifunctional transcriptional activator/DNA repair enzyme AdaA, partial [Blastocatellia bacterium]|nr:bifunctional transcriptional activator/DNA repair enzyme AdaA [Blastocatellia bacterium]
MTKDDNPFQEMEAMEQGTRWQAVQAKDARFNGLFVYGVRSTGIYCRPSCPSRRPRREQVEFFHSCEAAEKGGFRECLRCRPRRVEARDPRAEMVLRACRAIEARGEAGISLDALSEELAVSPHHLHRVFKKITGVTPRQYSAAFRLEGFKARIRNGEGVTRAIYESGYGSSSRLYEKSSEHLGMTPAT